MARIWLALLVVGVPCVALACTADRARPAAVPVIGPDGSSMLHISCGREEARCYQLAGAHCPMGYEIAPTPGAGGNFLVRCRAATPAPTWSIAQNQQLAPSPYAIQETVQPWPTQSEPLAPSPYRPAPQEYPPLSPGGKPAPADDGQQDLGF